MAEYTHHHATTASGKDAYQRRECQRRNAEALDVAEELLTFEKAAKCLGQHRVRLCIMFHVRSPDNQSIYVSKMRIKCVHSRAMLQS